MSCLHCKPDEDLPEEMEDVVLCDKCLQRQQERKETIYEIIETEINYGRDLHILKEVGVRRAAGCSDVDVYICHRTN